MLSDANARDPVLTWNEEVTLRLRVSNQQGCVGFDDINVKYYTGPEFYIPNAFSPNGDGVQDAGESAGQRGRAGQQSRAAFAVLGLDVGVEVLDQVLLAREVVVRVAG